MSAELERELRVIRGAMRKMAESSLSRVETALEALRTKDIDLARSIRAADDEIDRMELNIEYECMQVLARHQPVASDLRFIMATLRINTSLERSADLARSIAKRVIRLAECDSQIEIPGALFAMGEAACEMLRNATRAFETGDVELARYVRQSDAFVDERNREMFTWTIDELPGHPEEADQLVGLLMTSRAIERIGDIAANIAEDVMFAVGGSIVRHSPI